ncbi:recombinase RecT [bacterium]|nr:recombinase RecT [bacterium]
MSEQSENQLVLFNKNPMLMLSELDNIKLLPEAVQEKFAMMAYTKIQQAFDWEMAVKISSSNLVPKNYIGNPANTFLAIQTGRALGLNEFQSVQHLYTINGKTGVYGDMMLALAKKDPKYLDVIETQGPLVDAGGKHGKLPDWAKCVAKCKGQADREYTFTLDMARKNKNFNNEYTPWMTGNAARMMQFRARSFALRDAFPDTLAGVYDEYEIQEVRDITEEVNRETAASGLDAMEKEIQGEPSGADVVIDEKPEETPGPWALKLAEIVDKPEYYAIIQKVIKSKTIKAADVRSRDEKRAKDVFEIITEAKAEAEKIEAKKTERAVPPETATQTPPSAADATDESRDSDEDLSPEDVIRNDIKRLIELGAVKQATLYQNNFDKIEVGDGYMKQLEQLSIQLRKEVNKTEKK